MIKTRRKSKSIANAIQSRKIPCKQQTLVTRLPNILTKSTPQILSLHHIKNSNISIQWKSLYEKYCDLLSELETRKMKFITAFRHCQKWKKIQPTFFGLKHKSYPLFQYESIYHNPYVCSQIQNTINIITKDILQIVKDHTIILSIEEVEYRNKYGLLHTIPKKKISFIKNTYPNIQKRMLLSKQQFKQRHIQHIPKKPEKVRFGPIYIKLFYSTL